MADLYVSDLIVPEADPVEIQIDRVSLDAQVALEVTKYSSSDELLGTLVPPTTYVENSIEGKTRIRVFLGAGQVASGEKLRVRLSNSL